MVALLAAGLSLLCCAAAASTGAAASDLTCSISIQDHPGNAVTIDAGTELTMVADVSPGMPDGAQIVFFTGKGEISSYVDPTVTPTGGSLPYIFPVGTYDLRVDVRGSTGISLCTSTNDVVVIAGSPANRVTQTAITLNPANPAPGSDVTVTATVTIPQATEYTLGGNVVFFGDSARYATVPITSINATTGTATATFTVPSSEGSHVVSAWYLGDEHFAPSSAAKPIGVVRAQPSFTNVGAQSAHYGGTTTVTATLVDEALHPIPDRAVTLSHDGTVVCTTNTNAAGVATCPSVSVTKPAGNYDVTATFDGDSAYQPAAGTGTLAVAAASTTIAYVAPSTVAINQPATLTATLRDEFNNPLAGESVTLGFGADSCVATVAADGTASCTIPSVHEAAGIYTVSATYAGRTGTYTSASTTGQVTVVAGIPTQLTFVPIGLPVLPGLPTLVKFKLTDSAGPVANATVTVTYNGVTKTLTTDANGYAYSLFLAPAIGGPSTATATFAATSTRLARTGMGTLTVLPAPTNITVTNDQLIQQGTKPTLSAKLKLWNGTPLAGKVVTLSAGGASCTAMTDASGTASCTTTTAVTGSSRDVVVTASYAGQAGVLLPSVDTADGHVWSYYGSGCFVVGDRDVDGGRVDFWGSQWWKNNHLSRSSSDSSFKGWASSRSASAWTSKPGNSSSLPSGSLPAYMAVIVSSSMSKSGSAINGDVARIVIVKTSAGYDGNPGHAGTGTVVGTLP